MPDSTNVLDYNRYLYAGGNPLKYNDPSGHCPAPPEGMGATICMALFIQPESVPAGPFTVHGDGRGFQNNSDPAASRGYIWISTETGEVFSHMNPSVYFDMIDFYDPGVPIAMAPGPHARIADVTYPASTKNSWVVSGPNEKGEIVVNYKLVISGPLDQSGTAPYINGTITFFPRDDGSYGARWDRDAFPWAEAYYHDGNRSITTIFQDPAARGNPYDLFGVEPDMNPLQWAVREGQRFFGGFGAPLISHGSTNP